MTGLDRILTQIEEDSLSRCRQISEKAEKDAKAILEEAQAEAETIKAERKAQLDVKLERAKQSAESTAELRRNQIVLSEKLATIDDILERTLEIIKALPNKEYFEILKELVLGNAQKGKGELHLSPEDTKKIPQNFVSSINSALKSQKCEIALGDSVEIDSGFILTYGDIDVNCTFSAIASAKRDELRDALNQLLFS